MLNGFVLCWIDSLWCSWHWCSLTQEYLDLLPGFRPELCQLKNKGQAVINAGQKAFSSLTSPIGCELSKQSCSSCWGLYVDWCLFVSFFPQEVRETGNGRLLWDLQGRIFLYLFLLLFSGFWPSFRGYSSLHSCCWSTWFMTGNKRRWQGN